LELYYEEAVFYLEKIGDEILENHRMRTLECANGALTTIMKDEARKDFFNKLKSLKSIKGESSKDEKITKESIREFNKNFLAKNKFL